MTSDALISRSLDSNAPVIHTLEAFDDTKSFVICESLLYQSLKHSAEGNQRHYWGLRDGKEWKVTLEAGIAPAFS